MPRSSRPCAAVKVTPDLKAPGASSLIHVDLGQGKRRLGGSALAHVYAQVRVQEARRCCDGLVAVVVFPRTEEVCEGGASSVPVEGVLDSRGTTPELIDSSAPSKK